VVWVGRSCLGTRCYRPTRHETGAHYLGEVVSEIESSVQGSVGGQSLDSTASSHPPAETSGLGTVVDLLLPEELRRGAGAHGTQARILAFILLIVLGIAAAIVAVRGSAAQPIHLQYASAILACAGALIVGLRTGAPLAPIREATLGMIFVGSIGLIFASAGDAFPAAMMASLIPVIAYGVGGRRTAIAWSGLVLAGIIGAAVYAEVGTYFPYRGDMLGWVHWRFESFALMLFFMFVGALGIDGVIQSARAETEHVQEQMRRQDARYRDLVENIGDVMMEYSAIGECVYVSPHAMEVFGRRPDELLGAGYRGFIHPDHLELVEEASREAVMSPGRTINRNIRFLHAEGHWIDGEVSGRSFFDNFGERHFVSIFRDLSELYRAQRAMRHRDRLATAGTLAAGIAHQINNPIGSIRNASEYALLCAKDGDYAEVEQVLRTNIEQSARCGEIVRSLLLFASREPRAKASADLRDVVRRACDLTRSYAGERGVEVVVTCSDEPLSVEMSSIEIEQVLVNLVRNAIEAAPRSHRIEVEVEVGPEGERAVVTIRDDGRGIAPDDLEQVFDPFFTTRLEKGGSGLGLSVALGIAREHDGFLEIESVEGEGSMARLELPI